MKIIKIEIENINSIKGKWSIDFTDESYARNNNQFVICGETGSGKTTILDAITLGLYGCTPRVSISKDKNEVFSKGTSNCSATITYELNGELIQSQFSQRKAQNNPSGNMQVPSYLIKNLTTDVELYQGGAGSDFRNKTEKLTGLNYEQFGKSVLLAQGSFNQFLVADENDKASVLAKLNGTEEYKKAASALWEKAGNKIKECEDEIARIDSIETLSDELLADYKDKRLTLDTEIKQMNSEIVDLTKKLNWRKAFDDSQKELNEVRDNKKKLDDEIEAFKDKNIELQQAEIASKCEVQYSRYMDSVKKRGDNETDIKRAQEEISKLEKTTKESKAKYDNAKYDYDEVKKEKESKYDLWRKVREIDVELKGLKANWDTQQQRAENAKNEYNLKYTLVSNKNKKIEKDEAEIKKLAVYINEHRQDADLGKIISGLNENAKSIRQSITTTNGLKNEKKEKTDELTGIYGNLQSVNNEILKLEEELKEFVNSNYKSISAVLRHNCIASGQACPVCGSVNHPFCNDDTTLEENQPSENRVAAKASELSAELEAKGTEKAKLEKKSSELESTIHNLEESINTNYSKIKKEIQEINEVVVDWGQKVEANDYSEASDSLAKIVDYLTKVYKEYEEVLTLKEEKKSNVDVEKASLDTIDLEAFSNKQKAEEKLEEQQKNEYRSKLNERNELFGDKIVDEEERQYDEKLKELAEYKTSSENEYNNAQKDTEDIKSKLNLLEGQKIQTEKDVEETTKCLQDVMAVNNFSGIENLKKAFRKQEEIDELRTTRENLNNQKIECDTKLESAENKYKELEKEKLTEDYADKIESDISNCNTKKDEANKEIGQIKQILDENEEKVRMKNQSISRRDELVQEKLYYMDVKRIIGAKDGKDIDVFVQKMVLGNLLKSANGYLEQMLPDYSLVQKPDSLVIMLHDLNNSENNRPISNLSGGESFAISLSLALGIAEVASNSIHIETLFLDEGFGTLSGAPLDEAINCLRRLSNSGKTLGIITHVQRVIDSFDQKITARKVNGVSTLHGPGVKHNGIPSL